MGLDLPFRGPSHADHLAAVSSHGVLRPSVALPSARPLPVSSLSGSRHRRLAARRAITFRPRGFSPPRRVPPRGGCGFVAPRSRLWGSSRFRGCWAPSPRRDTLRSFPFAGSRTASPRPLPSCRYRRQVPPISILRRGEPRRRVVMGSPHEVALLRDGSQRLLPLRSSVLPLAFIRAARRRQRPIAVTWPRAPAWALASPGACRPRGGGRRVRAAALADRCTSFSAERLVRLPGHRRLFGAGVRRFGPPSPGRLPVFEDPADGVKSSPGSRLRRSLRFTKSSIPGRLAGRRVWLTPEDAHHTRRFAR